LIVTVSRTKLVWAVNRWGGEAQMFHPVGPIPCAFEAAVAGQADQRIAAGAAIHLTKTSGGGLMGKPPLQPPLPPRQSVVRSTTIHPMSMYQPPYLAGAILFYQTPGCPGGGFTMADNFQLFSEIVPVLKDKEKAWVEQILGDTDKREQMLTDAGIKLDAIDVDDWPGFAWEIDFKGELWLYAEEYGNVSHAGEFIRAFLARFRPADCWELTWAETCSKPRVGEFGGGALFITARSVRAISAVDWILKHRKAF
jgi:hypothetical protein